MSQRVTHWDKHTIGVQFTMPHEIEWEIDFANTGDYRVTIYEEGTLLQICNLNRTLCVTYWSIGRIDILCVHSLLKFAHETFIKPLESTV
jgi:hypothetical protein